jgi:anthranilate phosphoribosyltransferase
MKDLISKVNTLSDEEKLSLLQRDFNSKELIEILEELFLLDPKQESIFELFDCCGTGGDKANTFNISTATAVIAASTGIKICKNGGRSSSSKTGSVDVLEELGVNFSQSLETKLIGLKDYGLAFHSSKAIAEILAPLKNYARKNKISSFLSLLGPFTNPFILKGQIIGVGKKEWFEIITDIAKHHVSKGYTGKIVLVQSTSSSGQVFDEITSITKAKIRIIQENQSFDFKFDPNDFQLSLENEKSLKGGDNHHENADILRSIIENKATICQKETSLINLALLLSLNSPDLNQNNIRDLIIGSYKLAKTKLENGDCHKTWLNFLAFNLINN